MSKNNDEHDYVNGGMEVEGYDIYTPSLDDWYVEFVEKRVEEAYQLGVLHGINASSMACVKRDVMEFEDYGWTK